MKRIFISYRRDDTGGYARAIYQHFVARFGLSAIFMDLETLRPGYDFAPQLRQHLADAGAVLVLIGKDWLTARDDGTRRIDDPDDFVRMEVSLALQTGVPVVPILLGNTAMPGEADLPEDIRPLAGKHAVSVTHQRFLADMEPIVGLAARELGVATGWGRVTSMVARGVRRIDTPSGIYKLLCALNGLILLHALAGRFVYHAGWRSTWARAYAWFVPMGVASDLAAAALSSLTVLCASAALLIALLVPAFRRYKEKRDLAKGLLIAACVQWLLVIGDALLHLLLVIVGPASMQESARLELAGLVVLGLLPVALTLGWRRVRRLASSSQQTLSSPAAVV